MVRILVIDDEAVVREPITASLRAAGHDAVGFGDGTSALVEIRRTKPDLILLDVQLEGRDGISVLREIRKNPATTAIPVVLLTNSTDRDTVLQAARLGVQGYLLKSSFSLSELLSRVAKLSSPESAGAQEQAAAGL